MAKYTNIKAALKTPLDVTHLALRFDFKNKITEELLACENLNVLEIAGFGYDIPEAFNQFTQLETIVFRGRYQAFPAFIFGLKSLKNLSFEGYYMNNLPDKFDQLTHLESLKISSNFFNNPYTKFPNSIFKLTKLKQLKLLIDMQHLAQSIDQLPNLEYLQLHYSHSHPATMEAICNLTQLRTLHLSTYGGYNGKPLHLPHSVSNLKQLQTLIAYNNHISELPDSLKELKLLEWLDLSNGRFDSLPFQQGDLPNLHTLVLEQNKQLDIAKELNKLIHTNLKYLDLKSCRLREFPEVILQFNSLEELNLANNKINYLPLEIVKLPHLNNINTTKTPLAQTTEAKSGKPINKLLKLLRENQSPESFCKVSLALLLSDFDYLREVNSSEILPALNTPQNVVRENALIALEKHFPDPMNDLNKDATVITMIGKNKGLPINKTYQKLKDQEIQTSRNLLSTTTHVVLGTEPGEKLAKAQELDITWVLPQHLRAYLQKVEVPYLMQSDGSQNPVSSLEDLLLNNDPQNVTLGLTMMQEGGIPDDLLYNVVILSLKKNYPPNQVAKKVLERYTSEEFRAVLRKHSRKSMVNILWAFQQEELIDKKKLAIAALNFFKNEPNRYYYFNTLQRTAFELCFKQGGEVAKLALQARIQEGTLELTGFYIKEIPKELRHFNQLKFINMGGNGLKKLPDWLIEFTSLEKLDLTNNMFNKNEKNHLRNMLPEVKLLF